MEIRHSASKVFLRIGIVISFGGAIFAWFAYGVFDNGDCNPCPQPPLWVWLPLLLGLLFVAFGLVRLRNRPRLDLENFQPST